MHMNGHWCLKYKQEYRWKQWQKLLLCMKLIKEKYFCKKFYAVIYYVEVLMYDMSINNKNITINKNWRK